MLTDNRIASLTAENDELRERIRQLEGELCPRISIPAEWALSPTQERMFRALVARESMTYAGLAMCCTGGGSEDAIASRDNVQVQIWRLRRITSEHGVVIHTIYGRGYRLEDRKRWAVPA